ncbi:hypothetical protein B0T25DRAFT_276009 [Lasiosphaeria hispida]|uniref:Uncharacterized protein n=1 Tax=Lasiosphaeria hispida TaxID=260671 RepID=A0AAJ0HB04_9PEZI|nr:hypothetical protein B0T25DRAFT_276009 [Lasiosphaeria hispida]
MGQRGRVVVGAARVSVCRVVAVAMAVATALALDSCGGRCFCQSGHADTGRRAMMQAERGRTQAVVGDCCRGGGIWRSTLRKARAKAAGRRADGQTGRRAAGGGQAGGDSAGSSRKQGQQRQRGNQSSKVNNYTGIWKQRGTSGSKRFEANNCSQRGRGPFRASK